MSYCSKCGTYVEGRFCSRCGAQAPGASQGEAFGGGGTQQPLERNVASALCYSLGFVSGLLFLWIAPYKNDSSVRFHGYQSILFSAVLFVLHASVTIVALIVSLGSLELGVLVSSLHAVLSAVFFAAWLYLMWKSYQWQKVVLPVIGEMAERLADHEQPSAPSDTMDKAA